MHDKRILLTLAHQFILYFATVYEIKLKLSIYFCKKIQIISFLVLSERIHHENFRLNYLVENGRMGVLKQEDIRWQKLVLLAWEIWDMPY